MQILSKTNDLCEKQLTHGEIDRLIHYLRRLRARKDATVQVQVWQVDIPVRPGWELVGTN